ncbi:MAG TPA: exodeoxyribonuclease III [Thermoplasmatales archaeon]|nr:exodeoxyribonuclease III [Thermoplasmatales archaeon]
MFKIATWNINSINAHLHLVKEFIEKRMPDVVAFQETKIEDKNFPAEIFYEMGYNSVFKGQKAYNGVAILSKKDIDYFEKNFKEIEGEDKRILLVEVNGIKIINAYFPHGKMIDSYQFEFKINFIEKLMTYIKKNFLPDENLLLVGDFNVATEEKDVYAPEILQYSIGFSMEERKAIKELYKMGFTDIFRLHNKNSGEYTWWNYQSNSFRRNVGMRIDYIWARGKIANRSKNCFIDKEFRAKYKPSDHAPVIAEFKI